MLISLARCRAALQWHQGHGWSRPQAEPDRSRRTHWKRGSQRISFTVSEDSAAPEGLCAIVTERRDLVGWKIS